MPPHVSVVIPSYRAQAWIEATLESVVRQTYRSAALEVIVVDDASPDDSFRIAREFLDRHSVSHRVIRNAKNAGVAATRNVGWRIADGEWIQFLDADDLLAPHKIQLQAEHASRVEDSVAVVYSNWQHLLLEDGDWRPSGPVLTPFVDHDPVVQILQQFEFGYVGPALIRKSFLARIGGFDERPLLGEDLELMLRLAMEGGQFRQVRSEQAMFLYRQSPGSLWRAYVQNVEAMRNLLLSFRRVEEFLRARSPGGGLSEVSRAALAMRYSKWADFFLERDPATFRELMAWLHGLGLRWPTDLSRSLRLLSTLIGYENAIRIRSAYRNQVSRFR